MSALRFRIRRTSAVTTALAAGLLATLAVLPFSQPATAAPAAAPAALGVPSTDSAGGLTIENSFVSAQGWVKPGDTYPSRVLLTNPGAAPIAGATVTVTAPRGSSFTHASGPGSHPVTASEIVWTPGDVAPDETLTLVLESVAQTTDEEPTIV